MINGMSGAKSVRDVGAKSRESSPGYSRLLIFTSYQIGTFPASISFSISFSIPFN
jgi:hypothetical protein